MTHTLLKTICLALAMLSATLVPMLVSDSAEAKGFAPHQTSGLYLDAPLKRSWGRFGDRHCEGMRVAKRVCFVTGRGHVLCKVKGWNTRQNCF